MAYLETTNSSVQAVLVSFLEAIVPTGWDVIEGQDNRVAEPQGNFIVLTPTMKTRLSTNYVAWADVVFTSAISGNSLVISSVRFGTVDVVAQPTLWGVGVGPCNISQQVSGTPGGVGTYLLSGPPQVVGSQQMAAGLIKVRQATENTYQVDVHSVDLASSSDLAQTISTLWRDEVSVDFFDQSGVKATPLYCEDPRQTPFTDSEQQYETRWIIDLYLQVNAVVDWPMQFMDDVQITFEDVI